MSFGKPWSYSDSSNWARRGYPEAKGNNQTPINIDTSKTTDCNLLCQIALNYASSTCTATIQNKTPIIYFSSGSYIKFIKQKEILSLKAMTIHTPSIHMINGMKYDLEIVLYHKMSGNINPDSDDYIPGGTAISLLFQKGVDYGPVNNFLNSFIYKLPIDKQSIDSQINIPVSKDWGPSMLLPEIKSFYYYSGSLPFPPAEENWKWIVFEEIQGVSENIIENLKVAFLNNGRPIQPLNSRVPAYNSNIDFPTSKILKQKSDADIKSRETGKQASKTAIQENTTQTDGEKLRVVEQDKQRFNDWYKERKSGIKAILLAIILLLTVYAALKMVKYIVQEDILNMIMVRQAIGAKKQKLERIAANNKINNKTSPTPTPTSTSTTTSNQSTSTTASTSNASTTTPTQSTSTTSTTSTATPTQSTSTATNAQKAK